MDKISNKKTDGNFANTVLADAVFRPILFSTPMVQAILDGRKTQTRRIIKPQPTKQLSFSDTFKKHWSENVSDLKLPYFEAKYQIGDIMWVRETWSEGCIENGEHTGIRYKADDENFKVKWRPSIFMPKSACRIFLKVTNVRVERLQDISEQDAIAEGIESNENDMPAYFHCYKDYCINNNFDLDALGSFQTLWQSINGKENWKSNPWVWVYDFERVERPLGFC